MLIDVCGCIIYREHTTPISVEQSKPLEVEFRTHYPYVERTGAIFKKIAKQVVAIFVPQTDHYAELYLVGMTPGTALNLLRWLRENERLLRQLDDEK